MKAIAPSVSGRASVLDNTFDPSLAFPLTDPPMRGSGRLQTGGRSGGNAHVQAPSQRRTLSRPSASRSRHEPALIDRALRVGPHMRERLRGPAQAELAASPVRRFGIVKLGQPAAITVAVLIICAVMALISEPFRSYDNLYNDSRNFAFVAIMGMGPDVGDHHRRHRSLGRLRDGAGRHCHGAHASGWLSAMGGRRRGDGGGAHLRPRQRLRDRQVQALAIRRDADHAVGGAQPGAGVVQQQDDLHIRTRREAFRRTGRRQSVRHPFRRHRNGADRGRPHDRSRQHKLGADTSTPSAATSRRRC